MLPRRMILEPSRPNISDQTEDEGKGETAPIRWSNVIFVPFNPVFKLLVLSSVVTKMYMGPIQTVFPRVICLDLLEIDDYMFYLKYYYLYVCDLIYAADTFLHIVHRQVTDEAMRREFLPKPALLLLLDIVSLIPFYRLLSTDNCPPAQFYPNIMGFNECLCIYRIVQYFNWKNTHSIGKTFICFILLSTMIMNMMTCFLLLLTIEGLCGNCYGSNIYDWRLFVIHRLNQTENYDVSTYIYGSSFILSFFLNKLVDELKPSTYAEFLIIALFMSIGYLLYVFVLVPKIFAESVLSLRRVCTFHPRVTRIIEETKRRNPSPKAHVSVEKFYALMWEKRRGITSVPEIIAELPRYLRIDIRQDLVWPVFYHSPSLRKTSQSYKRWLCHFIHLDFKLPGERFFVGPHCFTNLYYLKTGIVQIISSDDSTSPLLSVTDGTIFGDISFAIPPLNRRVIVRCLTYCEVFYIGRSDIVKSLLKFPEDRRLVMGLASERIKHARSLYNCKKNVRGLDRSEEEGIAWLKRRWWEISTVISRRISDKKKLPKIELPPEEAPYHCAKFIGQVVLCTNVQLQRKSMFANVGFPWILLPQSSFGTAWNNIVIYTVYLVLIVYPPNLSKEVLPPWFLVVENYVDLVYICDIVVSLMTALDQHQSLSANFASVMFARFKRLHFLLDLLSTVWIERVVVIIGMSELYRVAHFNRLIKVYMLFTERYSTDWTIKKTPISNVLFCITVIHFCFTYVLAYFYYLVEERTPNLSLDYRFGTSICSRKNATPCDNKISHVLEIAIAWTFELNFSEYVPSTFLDVGVGMILSFMGFIIYMFTKLKLMAALYLKLSDMATYHCLVSNLKQHYVHHKLHKDLMRRLNRFLICHWKYYHGMDVMHINMLVNEPYDIYWKLHGEKAVKIISESPAFKGADSALVKELAHKSKFLVIPEKTVLFMLGVRSKTVTWVANGFVKCEYHNENGEIIYSQRSTGQILSFGTVFLQHPALKTFTASSDCEILYMKIKEFYSIIKRYPDEWAHIQTCLEEFQPTFDEMFQSYIRKHKDYQKKLRNRVFHAKKAVSGVALSAVEVDSTSSMKALKLFKIVPASNFIKFWLLFRTIIVVIQITCSSLQGGSGAMIRRPLILIAYFCEAVACMDIVLKLSLAYYDKRGLIINDMRKSIVHYGTRGLMLDILGLLPWDQIYTHVFSRVPDENDALLLNTISSFAHMYLVLGYFDYIADSPTVNYAYISIIKWQVFTLLIMMGTSHYFISKCITFKWDAQNELLSMQKQNGCWLPVYNELSENPTIPQLHVLFAQSLNLAQCALLSLNIGRFFVKRDKIGMGLTSIILGVIFWYLLSVCQTLLILKHRGTTLFEHGVIQLSRFLNAERVDKALIDRAECHFTYWWIRTKGLSVRSMIHERIGVVFRQDLSYYFYKRTFQTLNTLLRGDDSLEHELAGIQTQLYFLPKEDIMREMDLTPYVYVVHRGKVSITQDGKPLAVLTKGAIFGQLQGSEVRPIRVSAQAQEHVDILQIPINLFQEAIDDKVRENIAHNSDSAKDYMALKIILEENPYNTVQFILRGRKTIWLPWMDKPVEAQTNKWYSRWLFCMWLVGPTLVAVLVLTQKTLPPETKADYNTWLLLLDITFLAYVISNFFTTHLVIKDNECVHQYKRWNKLTQWGFYLDLASIFLPLVTTFNGDWNYQLARLLRLHLFHKFHSHFCRSFPVKTLPVLLKIVMVLILMHALTCGWMIIACRREEGQPFPTSTYPFPPHINSSIDYDQWALPEHRIGGCPRLTRSFKVNNVTMFSFLVPRVWQADYILALGYVLVLQTRTNMDHMVAITLEQIYYKIFMSFILYMVDIWVLSLAVSAIYMKLRKLYLYDYQVSNLITYLKHNGLSKDLLETVKTYTSQLWARQRGYWLPEITLQAPICLREDLFTELYMHHLEKATLFQKLPSYFLRQLVARLQRVVIFPGKCIVQEGDIHPCMYFIHEGEVEKCYTDEESGDIQLVSLLVTNGYFGLLPGFFPDECYNFSYYTRTVVDLVFLKHDTWQDLLDGYPDVKATLCENANKLKKSHTSAQFT